ncbi:hypothetical protein ACFXG6_17515 [Streptomyces roseus]|uniref:hypothetical protein n=1 Tax=Streptomyces roseus TaxID=66430 RepID=UPI003674C5BA
MHLIHLRLASEDGRRLPADAAAQLMAHGRRTPGLEHVSVSRSAHAAPTLGLFYSSQPLAEAETAALELALRVLRTPDFAGFSVEACGAALIPLPALDTAR